jgi:hypothetical protein
MKDVILFLFLTCNTFASQQVADKALEWQKCPPKNTHIPHDPCNTKCCSGSNWDLTCIGFVEAVTYAATNKHDAELVAGFPLPGQKFGSVLRSFEAMKKSGRTRESTSGISPGAAVYFSIVGFAPGHIAIATGKKNSAGEPLIVSTGGPKWGSGIRVESLSEMSHRQGWKFLGWADL